MISKAQKVIKQFSAELILTESQLTITLRSNNEDYVLATELQNDKLPLAFMNIFDNVADLFNFIRDATAGTLDLTANTLKIMVKAGIRLREVAIELTRTQISRQEVLERRVDKLEQNLKSTPAYLQKETQRLFEEFAKKNIKPLTDEVKKLTERVATLERQAETRPKLPTTLFGSLPTDPRLTLFSQNVSRVPKNPTFEEPFKAGSDSTDKLTRAESSSGTVQVPVERATFSGGEEGQVQGRRAKDFVFDIDMNNKFLSEFFTINNNHVTRKIDNEEIYMFSSTNPIPATDRHCVSFRVDKISEGLMWVGLLTEAKKQEQYIGEEAGIMQFSLEGSKVLIDGKGFTIKIPEFKDGQVLSMEVEIAARKLRFYRNGKPNPLVKITIPEALAAVKLYPYVQLIGEGDSITFL